MDVIRLDQSLPVRRHVARALSEAILMSLAIGDVAGTAAPGGLVDGNNDTEQAKMERADAHSKAIVKAIRQEFGKRQDLREVIQAMLL
jgi:transcription initiation factor TFIID subunit 2